jgi:hypothetical protein
MTTTLASLPKDIVNHILDYTGQIRYRQGKYMNQIARDDPRYELLLTIPSKYACTMTLPDFEDDRNGIVTYITVDLTSAYRFVVDVSQITREESYTETDVVTRLSMWKRVGTYGGCVTYCHTWT